MWPWRAHQQSGNTLPHALRRHLYYSISPCFNNLDAHSKFYGGTTVRGCNGRSRSGLTFRRMYMGILFLLMLQMRQGYGKFYFRPKHFLAELH